MRPIQELTHRERGGATGAAWQQVAAAANTRECAHMAAAEVVKERTRQQQPAASGFGVDASVKAEQDAFAERWLYRSSEAPNNQIVRFVRKAPFAGRRLSRAPRYRSCRRRAASFVGRLAVRLHQRFQGGRELRLFVAVCDKSVKSAPASIASVFEQRG